MTGKSNRRSFLRTLGAGAAGASAAGLAGQARAEPAPPPKYPEGTTGWAREMIVAGHRVRQRCWKDGAGCEMPQEMVEHFGRHYEKGIDKFKGFPIFMDMMVGNDWEIVS
jgi:hypothetical protein